MKTLKSFIESTNIPASLVRSVSRRIGGWADLLEHAHDVADHGADAGWHGFIYHRDTCSFYRRNRAALLELVKEQADEFGQSPAEFVAGFNCVKNIVDLSRDEVAAVLSGGRAEECVRTSVQNALAWYALEEVSRALVDFVEA